MPCGEPRRRPYNPAFFLNHFGELPVKSRKH